jgi:hypothetical protein
VKFFLSRNSSRNFSEPKTAKTQKHKNNHKKKLFYRANSFRNESFKLQQKNPNHFLLIKKISILDVVKRKLAKTCFIEEENLQFFFLKNENKIFWFFSSSFKRSHIYIIHLKVLCHNFS